MRSLIEELEEVEELLSVLLSEDGWALRECYILNLRQKIRQRILLIESAQRGQHGKETEGH